MYGLTNSGVGAGCRLPINAAVLHVTAPFGSTVSISKGGVTVKSLGPGGAHANIDGENADYYFSVTPSNYGAWTAIATLNGNTESDTVTVSSNKQYDIFLADSIDRLMRDAATTEWTRLSNHSGDRFVHPYESRTFTRSSSEPVFAITSHGLPNNQWRGYGAISLYDSLPGSGYGLNKLGPASTAAGTEYYFYIMASQHNAYEPYYILNNVSSAFPVSTFNPHLGGSVPISGDATLVAKMESFIDRLYRILN